MQRSLDLYLIAANGRYLTFSPSDLVERFEAESDDRVRRGIAWVESRKNRLVAWIGRVLRTGHHYYVKLEDRIDPIERVLKAMAGADTFVVYQSPSLASDRAADALRSLLKRQRLKHFFWLAVDLLVSAVVVLFTPVLAPIPGPNVFFYFPFLRLLSHYRAIRGCNLGLGASLIEFKSLPALHALEENLRTPRPDRGAIRKLAEGLKIRGLEQFLERMV